MELVNSLLELTWVLDFFARVSSTRLTLGFKRAFFFIIFFFGLPGFLFPTYEFVGVSSDFYFRSCILFKYFEEMSGFLNLIGFTMIFLGLPFFLTAEIGYSLRYFNF